MAKKKKAAMSKLASLEMKSLDTLRKISLKFDDPDMVKMFEASNELSNHYANVCLLPKVMDLLPHPRMDMQLSVFTMAARNIYGSYIDDFFKSMKPLNPAAREQVLQSINERFSQNGGPTSTAEHKTWIVELSNLGREHQSIVFLLMRWLGKPGIKWVRDFIRKNVKGVSLGAVSSLSSFPDKDRRKLIKLLCEKASKDKREILPEIAGIVDEKTVTYLSSFLRGSTWQERAHIAAAVSRNGIRKASGLVMELVGDTEWQVKQALVEELNIPDSNFSSLVKVLGYLITETHSRVRSQTERVLLRLGLEKCSKSKLKAQRERLEKKFRTQLLKAARANRDMDTRWLGVEHEKADPISEILKKVADDDSEEGSKARPEGVSLADIATPKKKSAEEKEESEDKAVLLSALLGAKKASQKESAESQPTDEMPLDPTLPTKSKFMLLLQHSSGKHGKDVPLNELITSAKKYSLTEEELFETMDNLEKQGIIYRSSKGTVSYVDLEM